MRIGLVAHDERKGALLEWVLHNTEELEGHTLVATGTTGTMIASETGMKVELLLSGPKGGDQQIGSRIATDKLDMLVFFWDPMSPQPHDTDVKALLRLATYWNTPTACNIATADMIITSTLFDNEDYKRILPDVEQRTVEVDSEGVLLVEEQSPW